MNKSQSFIKVPEGMGEKTIEEFKEVKKSSRRRTWVPKIRRRSNSEPEQVLHDLATAHKDPVIVEDMKKECAKLQTIT